MRRDAARQTVVGGRREAQVATASLTWPRSGSMVDATCPMASSRSRAASSSSRSRVVAHHRRDLRARAVPCRRRRGAASPTGSTARPMPLGRSGHRCARRCSPRARRWRDRGDVVARRRCARRRATRPTSLLDQRGRARQPTSALPSRSITPNVSHRRGLRAAWPQHRADHEADARHRGRCPRRGPIRCANPRAR